MDPIEADWDELAHEQRYGEEERVVLEAVPTRRGTCECKRCDCTRERDALHAVCWDCWAALLRRQTCPGPTVFDDADRAD